MFYKTLIAAALLLPAVAVSAQMAPGQPPMDHGPGGPPPMDRGPGGPSPRGAMGPVSASTFVMKAGAGDLYEKGSSQLVLRSRNPEVRRFATMMIRDHTNSTAKVKRAAMQARVRVAPPKLEPKQARMIADLRRARGGERDRMYIEQQKMAHHEALMLHSGYAENGGSRPLRMAAGEIAPVVQGHIDMLDRM